MKLEEELKQHIAREKVSQNQIARSLGVSGGVISAWLGGAYKGDNEKLSHSIRVYLCREKKRRQALAIPTVQIDAYRQIHLAMDVAAEEIDIALIRGQAAAKQYINWRLRTIYQTNILTAYSADETRQMLRQTHLFPYWQYK